MAERSLSNLFGVVADKDTQMARVKTCVTCEHIRFGSVVTTCKLCGCVIKAKAALASSTCPANKWPAVPSEQ